MSGEPIRVRHRYTGETQIESVYGEPWLRWAYETGLGRLTLRLVATRPWFSRWYGWRMNRTSSRAKIDPFIRQFEVNSREFLQPPESFRTFNEFFMRRLRPEARPLSADPDAVVFPADGRHLGFPNLAASDQFFVKGQRFDLARFVADEPTTRRFTGGAAVFSRLCPVDYHRFHFPAAGVPSAPVRIEGWLWSVNPIALRRNLFHLWQNRRWRCEIDAGPMGAVLMAEIGATNVGSVQYTFAAGKPVNRGDEKGVFCFGGSAILTLFEPGRIHLCHDLLEATAAGCELYAHARDAMGTPARK